VNSSGRATPFCEKKSKKIGCGSARILHEVDPTSLWNQKSEAGARSSSQMLPKRNAQSEHAFGKTSKGLQAAQRATASRLRKLATPGRAGRELQTAEGESTLRNVSVALLDYCEQRHSNSTAEGTLRGASVFHFSVPRSLPLSSSQPAAHRWQFGERTTSRDAHRGRSANPHEGAARRVERLAARLSEMIAGGFCFVLKCVFAQNRRRAQKPSDWPVSFGPLLL